jgi:hypothetical protein
MQTHWQINLQLHPLWACQQTASYILREQASWIILIIFPLILMQNSNLVGSNINALSTKQHHSRIGWAEEKFEVRK